MRPVHRVSISVLPRSSVYMICRRFRKQVSKSFLKTRQPRKSSYRIRECRTQIVSGRCTESTHVWRTTRIRFGTPFSSTASQHSASEVLLAAKSVSTSRPSASSSHLALRGRSFAKKLSGAKGRLIFSTHRSSTNFSIVIVPIVKPLLTGFVSKLAEDDAAPTYASSPVDLAARKFVRFDKSDAAQRILIMRALGRASL